MTKKPFLFLILILSLVLALYNAIAIKLHLYWITNWLDSPSHLLGGFVSILILSTALSFLNFKKIKPNSTPFLFLGVLVVGILWEIFEVKYHITFPGLPGYWPDTLSDIFFDLLGATLAYYYLIKSFYDRK